MQFDANEDAAADTQLSTQHYMTLHIDENLGATLTSTTFNSIILFNYLITLYSNLLQAR